MKLAKGTVCVIDRSLLEHLWCLMDIYLAVEKKKKKDNNYKLDFYTMNNESAVGLTDGFINRDSNDLVKKLKRESNFSIELVEKALDVNVGDLVFDEKEKFYERFLKTIRFHISILYLIKHTSIENCVAIFYYNHLGLIKIK